MTRSARRWAMLVVWGLLPWLDLQARQPAVDHSGRDPIVDRFLTRQDQPLRSYRARRRLEARNDRFKALGWLEVDTEFSAARGLQWTVISEGGSAYVRRNVLRKALDAEVEVFRTGGGARSALSDHNYVFGAAAEDVGATVRIGIEPRRRDVLLVSGAILTDEHGDLLAVMGRLAGSPSIWARAVDIVRQYGRINGVRVPLAMESRANVRIAGRSEFRMTYEYEQINDEAVR